MVKRVFDKIEFNTTDGLQGRESEIMFSCVRARVTSGSIRVLENIRCVNVDLICAE